MKKTKSQSELEYEVIEDFDPDSLEFNSLRLNSLDLKEMKERLDADLQLDLEDLEEDLEFDSGEKDSSLPVVSNKARSRVLPPDPVKRTKKIAWASLLLSAVAVVISLAAYSLILVVLKENEELDTLLPPVAPAVTPVEEGNFIQYQGSLLPVKEDVPTNDYDARGFFVDNQGFVRYEMDDARGIVGIDVSYHQQEIDWAEVAAAGVEFAMIRVGRRGYGEEGTLGLDTHYVENILGATANGIHVGVYFFSQATSLFEIDEEVTMLLNLIDNFNISYPVVFDWEYITTADWARTNEVTGEEVTTMAKYFCDKVALAGYTPSIYFNMDMGYLSYDLSQLKEYSFWLAELNTRPLFHYHFDMWQYTFTGKVPGIAGSVDMNLSFRDFAAE